MKKHIDIFLLITTLTSIQAQTISNVQVRQEGLEIIITYDMAGALQGIEEIMLGVSTDGGKTFAGSPDAEGDIGKNVKPGFGKTITLFAVDALAGLNTKFNSIVISLSDKGTMGEKIEALGVSVLTLDMPVGRPTLRGVVKLRQLIKKLQPDLIQGWMYHGNLAATLVATCNLVSPHAHMGWLPRAAQPFPVHRP